MKLTRNFINDLNDVDKTLHIFRCQLSSELTWSTDGSVASYPIACDLLNLDIISLKLSDKVHELLKYNQLGYLLMGYTVDGNSEVKLACILPISDLTNKYSESEIIQIFLDLRSFKINCRLDFAEQDAVITRHYHTKSGVSNLLDQKELTEILDSSRIEYLKPDFSVIGSQAAQLYRNVAELLTPKMNVNNTNAYTSYPSEYYNFGNYIFYFQGKTSELNRSPKLFQNNWYLPEVESNDNWTGTDGDIKSVELDGFSYYLYRKCDDYRHKKVCQIINGTGYHVIQLLYESSNSTPLTGVNFPWALKVQLVSGRLAGNVICANDGTQFYAMSSEVDSPNIYQQTSLNPLGPGLFLHSFSIYVPDRCQVIKVEFPKNTDITYHIDHTSNLPVDAIEIEELTDGDGKCKKFTDLTVPKFNINGVISDYSDFNSSHAIILSPTGTTFCTGYSANLRNKPFTINGDFPSQLNPVINWKRNINGNVRYVNVGNYHGDLIYYGNILNSDIPENIKSLQVYGRNFENIKLICPIGFGAVRLMENTVVKAIACNQEVVYNRHSGIVSATSYTDCHYPNNYTEYFIYQRSFYLPVFANKYILVRDPAEQLPSNQVKCYFVNSVTLYQDLSSASNIDFYLRFILERSGVTETYYARFNYLPGVQNPVAFKYYSNTSGVGSWKVSWGNLADYEFEYIGASGGQFSNGMAIKLFAMNGGI